MAGRKKELCTAALMHQWKLGQGTCVLSRRLTDTEVI